MSKRKVVTRSKRIQHKGSNDFVFSRDIFDAIKNNGDTPGFYREYRSNAWQKFEELSIPNTNEEAWRRTSLRNLPASRFKLPPEIGIDDVQYEPPPIKILEPLVGELHGGQIVISPEGIQTRLNPELYNEGVIFVDFRTALTEHTDQVEKILGKIVKVDESKFSSMTAALSQTGVFVFVPEGVHVNLPLHSILWGSGTDLAYLSHIMIWLEQGASLTYVHESASPPSSAEQLIHSGIVEIHVDRGANLRFVELQSWGKNVWNFTHERARIEQDGNLDWIFGAVGSHLTKNFSDLDLIGRGANARMSGFYFVNGTQHLDHDTQQNHLAPDTTSDLLFKGALNENSRSVWQGMIYVAPGAQKTDGFQANRNLILSSNARADSIPGLEILADDVRCTHGATVGKIDESEVFYLQSRGIDRYNAVRLIVNGFFDPIMQRIPFDGVRSRLINTIIEKMG